MKNKFYQSIAGTIMGLTLLITAGCKKFTEVEPVSQYSIPQAFSDVSNATSALIGVYDELQGDNGYGIRISIIVAVHPVPFPILHLFIKISSIKIGSGIHGFVHLCKE